MVKIKHALVYKDDDNAYFFCFAVSFYNIIANFE